MLNQNKSQSTSQRQEQITRSQGMETKSLQQSLRGSLNRYKKPKQYLFMKRQNQISVDNQSTKMEQSSFCSKYCQNGVMANKIIQNQQKSKQHKKDTQNGSHKETFKEFIKKIQTYNKNKIINDLQTNKQKNCSPQTKKHTHSTEICIKSNTKNNIDEQISLSKIQKSSINNNSVTNFAQNYPFQITSKELNAKNLISIKSKDRTKKFIIHENANKTFYTRYYRRSKTQQQIKLDPLEFENHNVVDKNSIQKQPIEKQSDKSISTFYITNAKKSQKPLNHVSLKLMQQQKIHQQSISCTEVHIQKNIKSFDSQKVFGKLKDNDLSKHKKLLQTKFSKIRIRLGSSLYNKNLLRFDGRSKQNLRKQLQTICSQDLVASQVNQRQKKQSTNSIFCQNKILEAQNAFIQKRRLLPTAGTQFRQDVNKTNKKFFSMTNSFKRHRTIGLDTLEEKSKKGENINGWQITEDGITHYKIQQFF